MAGDWIKMRSNLWDDPRVSSLCDQTGESEASIVGGLYWLWATADQHSIDGILAGMAARSIDRKTGIAGFGDALARIGWIAEHPEGLRIVRFDNDGLPIFLKGSTPTRPSWSVWQEIRSAIFKRDDYTCQYCGERGKKLECDHVIPVSRGGVHTDDNLVTACFACNRSKRDKLISEWKTA